MGEPLSAEDRLAPPCGTSLRHADPERHTPERLSVELGASDLFVFRRVTNSRFVHVGGAGRGKTWAGDIELDVDIDPLGLQLRIGEPLWIRHTEPRHIFGPYYAAAAAAVRLSRDVLIIFGATSDEAASFELTSADLIDAATGLPDSSRRCRRPNTWPTSSRLHTRAGRWQTDAVRVEASQRPWPTWP